MIQDRRLAVLRGVSFLAKLDEATLSAIAVRARVQEYKAESRIVSELEFGADVYVIAQGQAEVSVQSKSGERQVLGQIGPGKTFGEMASLTGELRSATVRAVTPVEAIVISDRDFDELRVCRPEVAIWLVHVLSQRLGEAERTLDSLLKGKPTGPIISESRVTRSSLPLLWRELVVNHEKDLAFLTLLGFVVTLIIVRAAVFLAFTFDYEPREVLRIAYLLGFGLVILSACAALLTFRPTWRRAISLTYGIGAALIINELGVTLAFDIFYKDMHTVDPAVAFDVERLYRRAEPIRAIVVGLVVLVQAVYLKTFYSRVWFLVKMRIARVLSGR